MLRDRCMAYIPKHLLWWLSAYQKQSRSIHNSMKMQYVMRQITMSYLSLWERCTDLDWTGRRGRSVLRSWCLNNGIAQRQISKVLSRQKKQVPTSHTLRLPKNRNYINRISNSRLDLHHSKSNWSSERIKDQKTMKQAMLISPLGTIEPHTHTSKVFTITTLYYRLAVLQDIQTERRKC